MRRTRLSSCHRERRRRGTRAAAELTKRRHDTMAGAGTSAVPGVTEKERFEAELEFVQALANPEYLHHLAQNRYLDDPDFLAFLEYLQYWREPRYCKYLQFPHCLRMLELLDNEAFRTALKRADFKDMVLTQQHGHWKGRALAEPAPEPTEPAEPVPAQT